MFFVIIVMSDIDFTSYADDNTPYVAAGNDSIKIFKWFSDNQMKTNKDKCHLIVSNNKHVLLNFKKDLDGFTIRLTFFNY